MWITFTSIQIFVSIVITEQTNWITISTSFVKFKDCINIIIRMIKLIIKNLVENSKEI